MPTNRQRGLHMCLLAFFSLLLLSCASAPTHSPGPAPSIESLSRKGQYEIRAYTTAPVPQEYSRATIYYPLNVDGSIGGVAIAPGFTESQRHINWWGSRLASHGYAVLVFDTNDPRDRPPARADALMAGVATLRAENSRSDSPLHGRIDTSKMAVMGHSMGGGGALLAANQYSEHLSAAIPFTSWQPDTPFTDISIPTLVIAGEADRIAAIAEHAWPHYDSIPPSTEKVYLEIADGNHFIGNNPAVEWHPLLGRYAVAWLKIHMDGDERYREFIYGEPAERDAAHFFSRYEINSSR